uniref:Uncharacterized protein n=1 Tax=Varanus komodoensis TaxID=61221 RepID=A0A8D2ISK8_VARKO
MEWEAIFSHFFSSCAILILYILVRLLSEAGTGTSVNVVRPRLQEKLVILRYDPAGKKKVKSKTMYLVAVAAHL